MTLTYRTADGSAPFEIRDGAAYWIDRNAAPIPCLWFAKCPNAAVTSLAHPVLGDVPVCAGCADLAERAGA